jgi:hypothetical protein
MFQIAGTLFLAVQSKQVSQCTAPASEVKNSQKPAEKKEPPTKPVRMPTSTGAATENSQAQKTPESNNDSLAQTAASTDSAKTNSQSAEVIKCKATTPVSGKETVDSKGPSADQHNGKDSSAAYPEIVPHQLQKSGISEATNKSQEPPNIIIMSSPAIEDEIKPETTSQSEHRESTSVLQFEAMLSSCQNSTNATDSMEPTSSTEQLLSTAASPAPLRPAKRIADVNTIKRQPKGGWL